MVAKYPQGEGGEGKEGGGGEGGVTTNKLSNGIMVANHTYQIV